METALPHLHRSLLSAFALTAVLAGPLPVCADTTISISVRTGESTIVRTPGLERIAVGDGRIAGVVSVADGEIIINGKTPGRTSLLIWEAGGRRAYDIVVREQSLDGLSQMLQTAVHDPDVHVGSFDRSLVLTGSVDTGERLAHLGDIVDRFAPMAAAEKYTIVNAVTVARPLGPLQSELAASPATSGVRVDRDAKGNLIVSGQVVDRSTAERVLGRVRALAGPYLGIDGKVVDRLETQMVSQVDVKVYVLEVDETALRDLGINLQSATFNRDGSYTLGQPQFPVVESPLAGPNGSNGPGYAGRALTIGSFFRSITLAPTLNLIVNSGHARVLSSPDLVMLPGHKGDFLVGGELPIPYASGPQQIAIEYKEFGVRLDVTPTILGNGGVETVISPEVSDLDYQDGVVLNGFSIPALRTSKLSTDVVTNAGESIVLGGLLRRQEARTVEKIPGLGDLPILGKLFRSTRYQSAQTDVVFVMTPQILSR